MRRRRAFVAQVLISHPESRARVSDEGIDILNTFELLAYLVRSETLRLEDAWINFSAWAVPWWYVYEEGIERLRAQDETVFEDYKRLVQDLVDYEAGKRKLPRADLLPTQPILERFLESEYALLRRLVPERKAALRDLVRTLWKRLTGP
jgi:hypothetical protein